MRSKLTGARVQPFDNFADSTEGDSHDRSCRRLFLAILARSVADAFWEPPNKEIICVTRDERSFRGSEQYEATLQATHWYLSDDPRLRAEFDFICDAAGVDPEGLRRRIIKCIRGEVDHRPVVKQVLGYLRSWGQRHL